MLLRLIGLLQLPLQSRIFRARLLGLVGNGLMQLLLQLAFLQLIRHLLLANRLLELRVRWGRNRLPGTSEADRREHQCTDQQRLNCATEQENACHGDDSARSCEDC